MVNIYNKRNFTKTCLLTCTGLVAASYNCSSISLFNSSKEEEKVVGIPDEWRNIAGEDVDKYARYILSYNFKNITPRMVLSPHFKCRKGVKNTLPPRKMWKKIVPTLKAVDELCDQIGLPIDEMLSAYRCPDYNKAVRGNIGSYHMTNQAIDVVFKRTSAWRVAKAAKHLRDDKKVFKGGIGLYRGFVHIDTRGENVNW